VQHAHVHGPRGSLQVYGVVMDAWWFDESQARRDAVRGLARLHGAGHPRAAALLGTASVAGT
jgi:hypothetical protein